MQCTGAERRKQSPAGPHPNPAYRRQVSREEGEGHEGIDPKTLSAVSANSAFKRTEPTKVSRSDAEPQSPNCLTPDSIDHHG